MFDDEKVSAVDTCHSGGAIGADTLFEKTSALYGVKVRAYSYNNSMHKSPNKVEITEEEFEEGMHHVREANKSLKRNLSNMPKEVLGLLARNWAQVKHSDQVFAVSSIVNPNEKDHRGLPSKCKKQSVVGGTGWACQMCIDNGKELYVYDQNVGGWFKWSYISDSFVRLKSVPKITSANFAGIGTRRLNDRGTNAIIELYTNTFNGNGKQ